MTEQQKININNTEFQICIESTNKRASSVSINGQTITIKLSRWFSREERAKQQLKFLSWAIKRIEKYPKKFAREKEQFKDKIRIEMFGKEYKIRREIENRKSITAGLAKDREEDGMHIIKVKLPAYLSEEQQVKYANHGVSAVVAQELLPEFTNYVQKLNQQYFNSNPNLKSIRIKNINSKHGSCSQKGNITIAFKILEKAPEDVIRYVCIHELAHLTEMNHSKKFWQLVANAVPDYKGKREWIRKNL